MKRPALAMAAAIALALSVPGMASAIGIHGILDQSNPADTPTIGSDNWMAQTFTAGKSGLLTYVQLWLQHTGALSVSIRSTTGGRPDLGLLSTSPDRSPTETPGWVMFPLDVPVPVNAGTMYAIVFNTDQDINNHDAAYGSGDTYAGGQAYQDLAGTWGAVSGTLLDFAFQTYVDPQTISLQWDKTQVAAGVSTALTLTETLVFPTYRVVGVVEPNPLSASVTVNSVTLPTWFSVASVVCSSQIALADCTPANVQPGASISLTPDGNPITLTLTGTALASSAGTASGKAESCMGYNLISPTHESQAQPAALITLCVSGEAAIGVGAPAITPAPTSTGGAPSPTSSGSGLLLLVGLAAAGCGLFAVNRRRVSLR